MLSLTGRLLIAAAMGYLAGSFPSGVLVTRLLGRPDPRFAGSGHIGGRNVWRLAGFGWGVVTALVDAGKGVLAAWLALRLTGTPWALTAAGMGAVAGHCWSLYIGFAGGMGLGALGGLFLWQGPLAVPVAAALWGLGYRLLRDSPRGVMAMNVVMVPVFLTLARLGYLSPQATALGIGGVAIVFLRHLTQLPLYDRRRAE
jgi:glycerol-3-phosphate acyltransferase PlsY